MKTAKCKNIFTKTSTKDKERYTEEDETVFDNFVWDKQNGIANRSVANLK